MIALEGQGMIKIELASFWRRGIWRWPGVVNFILGGAGTGFYLLSYLSEILQDGMFAMTKPVLYGLLGPVLVSVGFLALATEAVRPLRSRYLFRHVTKAWMSRETLFGAIFVSATVLDWFFPAPILRVLAIPAALAMMISQGFIVYRIRAIPTWNMPIIPFLFLSSGFTSGYGLLLLMFALNKLPILNGHEMVGLVCVGANMGAWLIYLLWCRSIDFRKATKELRSPNELIVTVGIGHVVPLLLLLLLLLLGLNSNIGAGILNIIAAVSGLAMLTGVVEQKAGIILKASYSKEITLYLGK